MTGDLEEVVHEKWLQLQHQARRGPVATRVPTLGQYLDRWLSDVIAPSLAPATSTNYAMFVRLYIAPKLGHRPSTS